MIHNKVLRVLEKSGIAYEIKEFEEDFKDSKHAAELIGIELSRIAKCLAFRLPIGVAVLIMAGDARIDSQKYQKRFKVPLYRLDEEELLDYTGYVPGAVTPIALSYKKAKVFMDISLKPYLDQFIYPSGGTLCSAVGVKTSDLYDLANCREWIDISE